MRYVDSLISAKGVEDLPLLIVKTGMTPAFKFDESFEILTPDRSAWTIDLLVPFIIKSSDGSVINEATGAGVYCENVEPILEIIRPSF